LARTNGRPVLVAKEIVSDEKQKPVLNEEILAKLLEAAWVLQEHNRAQQKVDLNLEMHSEQLREREQANRVSPPPTALAAEPEPTTAPSTHSEDYTSTLAKIVETQHQIQLRQLDLESSMEMVLERLLDITKASGAAVGVVDGKKVRYPAGIGPAALSNGTEVEKENALCFDCLRTGQVARCPDITSEFLLDVNECQRRGIQALIAVPVYHDGGVAGALELYFSTANSFRETDVHSCQLMAGLVTEALARDEEVTWKKSLAEERSVMLEALEKIKPNLAALAGDALASAPTSNASSSTESSVCHSCGAELVSGEQYCGGCGSPAVSAEPPVSFQTKLGSFLSALPAEKEKQPSAEPLLLPHDPFAPVKRTSTPASDTIHFPGEPESAAHISESKAQDSSTVVEGKKQDDKETSPDPAHAATALATEEDRTAWTSAAKAKDFLEQLAADQKETAFGRFWQARRGDIYLAVAVILVAIVVRWGIWSEHSVSATGAPVAAVSGQSKQPAPEADVSLFDKMLISLGLADAPEAPQKRGNPDTQVWVDLHTALYYCPGADLYGKTPKGRYATQRDAQLDQFEPAYRKTCD
jgi:GAF domain-containing protein